MGQPRGLRAFGCRGPAACGIVFALSVVACSPTFRAASATGQSAQKIAEDAPVLASGSNTCDLLLALEPKTQGCDEVRAQAERWSLAAHMLADYGTALRALAEADDPDVSASVSALLARTSQSGWLRLGADRDAKLATAASALTAAVSQQYRRQALGRTVLEADAHVGYVADRLAEHVDVQVAQLDLALGELDDHLKKPILGDRCAELPAPPVGSAGGAGSSAIAPPSAPAELCFEEATSERLAYVEARSSASARRARLLAVKSAVRAFRAAHAALKRHTEKPELDDLAAYEDVLGAVQAVYQAVEAPASAPASSAPPPPGG